MFVELYCPIFVLTRRTIVAFKTRNTEETVFWPYIPLTVSDKQVNLINQPLLNKNQST